MTSFASFFDFFSLLWKIEGMFSLNFMTFCTTNTKIQMTVASHYSSAFLYFQKWLQIWLYYNSHLTLMYEDKRESLYISKYIVWNWKSNIARSKWMLLPKFKTYLETLEVYLVLTKRFTTWLRKKVCRSSFLIEQPTTEKRECNHDYQEDNCGKQFFLPV